MRENCEILVFRNLVKFSFSFFCSPRRFGFSIVSTVFSSSRGFPETRFEEGKRSELPPLPFRTPKWISRRARRSRNDRDAISADQVGQTFPRFARLKVLARARERERIRGREKQGSVFLTITLRGLRAAYYRGRPAYTRVYFERRYASS